MNNKVKELLTELKAVIARAEEIDVELKEVTGDKIRLCGLVDSNHIHVARGIETVSEVMEKPISVMTAFTECHPYRYDAGAFFEIAEDNILKKTIEAIDKLDGSVKEIDITTYGDTFGFQEVK